MKSESEGLNLYVKLFLVNCWRGYVQYSNGGFSFPFFLFIFPVSSPHPGTRFSISTLSLKTWYRDREWVVRFLILIRWSVGNRSTLQWNWPRQKIRDIRAESSGNVTAIMVHMMTSLLLIYPSGFSSLHNHIQKQNIMRQWILSDNHHMQEIMRGSEKPWCGGLLIRNAWHQERLSGEAYLGS